MVTLDEVFQELVKRGMSLEGNEMELRERLLKTLLIEHATGTGVPSFNNAPPSFNHPSMQPPPQAGGHHQPSPMPPQQQHNVNANAPTGCGFIPQPPPSRYRPRAPPPARAMPPPSYAHAPPQSVYYNGWMGSPAMHMLNATGGKLCPPPHPYVMDAPPPPSACPAPRPTHHAQQPTGNYYSGRNEYVDVRPAGGYRNRVEAMMAQQQQHHHHQQQQQQQQYEKQKQQYMQHQAGDCNNEAVLKNEEYKGCDEKRPSAYDEEKQQARILKLRKMAAELEVKRILARATPEAWRLNHEISQLHKWLRQAEKRQAREHAKRRHMQHLHMQQQQQQQQQLAPTGQMPNIPYAAYANAQQQLQAGPPQVGMPQHAQGGPTNRYPPYNPQQWMGDDRQQLQQQQQPHPYLRMTPSPNSGHPLSTSTSTSPGTLCPGVSNNGSPSLLLSNPPQPQPQPSTAYHQHDAAESEEGKQGGETTTSFNLPSAQALKASSLTLSGDETEQKESLLSSAYPQFGRKASFSSTTSLSPDHSTGSGSHKQHAFELSGQDWLSGPGDKKQGGQIDLAASNGTAATADATEDEGDTELDPYEEQLDNCCSLLRDYL